MESITHSWGEFQQVKHPGKCYEEPNEEVDKDLHIRNVDEHGLDELYHSVTSTGQPTKSVHQLPSFGPKSPQGHFSRPISEGENEGQVFTFRKFRQPTMDSVSSALRAKTFEHTVAKESSLDNLQATIMAGTASTTQERQLTTSVKLEASDILPVTRVLQRKDVSVNLPLSVEENTTQNKPPANQEKEYNGEPAKEMEHLVGSSNVTILEQPWDGSVQDRDHVVDCHSSHHQCGIEALSGVDGLAPIPIEKVHPVMLDIQAEMELQDSSQRYTEDQGHSESEISNATHQTARETHFLPQKQVHIAEDEIFHRYTRNGHGKIQKHSKSFARSSRAALSNFDQRDLLKLWTEKIEADEQTVKEAHKAAEAVRFEFQETKENMEQLLRWYDHQLTVTKESSDQARQADAERIQLLSKREEELKKLGKYAKGLDIDTRRIKGEHDELKEQFKSLQQTLREVQTAAEKASGEERAKFLALRVVLGGLNHIKLAQLRAIMSDKQSLGCRLAAEQAKVTKLEQEHKQAMVTFQDLKQSFTQVGSNLKQDFAGLRGEIYTIPAPIVDMSMVDSKFDQCLLAISEVANKPMEVTSAHDKSEKNWNAWREKLSNQLDLFAQKQSSVASVETIKNVIAGAVTNLEKNLIESEALQCRITELETTKFALQENLTTSKITSSSLEKERDELRQNYHTLQQDFEKATADMQTAMERPTLDPEMSRSLLQAEEKVIKFQELLKEKQRELDQAKEQISTDGETLNNLTIEKESLTAELDEAKKIISNHVDKEATFVNELISKENAVKSALQKQFKDIEQKLKREFSNTKHQLQNEVQRLSQVVHTIETERDEAVKERPRGDLAELKALQEQHIALKLAKQKIEEQISTQELALQQVTSDLEAARIVDETQIKKIVALQKELAASKISDESIREQWKRNNESHSAVHQRLREEHASEIAAKESQLQNQNVTSRERDLELEQLHLERITWLDSPTLLKDDDNHVESAIEGPLPAKKSTAITKTGTKRKANRHPVKRASTNNFKLKDSQHESQQDDLISQTGSELSDDLWDGVESVERGEETQLTEPGHGLYAPEARRATPSSQAIAGSQGRPTSQHAPNSGHRRFVSLGVKPGKISIALHIDQHGETSQGATHSQTQAHSTQSLLKRKPLSHQDDPEASSQPISKKVKTKQPSTTTEQKKAKQTSTKSQRSGKSVTTTQIVQSPLTPAQSTSGRLKTVNGTRRSNQASRSIGYSQKSAAARFVGSQNIPTTPQH